jgi:hypothetical protein
MEYMLKKMIAFGKNLSRKSKLIVVLVVGAAVLLIVAVVGYIALQLYSQTRSNSPAVIGDWFRDRANRPALMTYRDQCPGAPFILPSDGFIGLLWGDPAGPYNIYRRHTGIDIFGNGAVDEVPVYAVYDGYLTRLDNWISTVIIRHDDPLVPGRKIWSYYTHLASEDGTESCIDSEFPPGTQEKFVEQGTLLGYQGNYAGSAASPVGIHVHLSLVTSEDSGAFKNEAVLSNTLDPSHYFGMPLNIDTLPDRPIQCSNTESR